MTLFVGRVKNFCTNWNLQVENRTTNKVTREFVLFSGAGGIIREKKSDSPKKGRDHRRQSIDRKKPRDPVEMRPGTRSTTQRPINSFSIRTEVVVGILISAEEHTIRSWQRWHNLIAQGQLSYYKTDIGETVSLRSFEKEFKLNFVPLFPTV